MKLARFYPIVDSAAWVKRIVGAGARLVQLRIKDGKPAHMRNEISAAKKICAAAGAQLVVNDYWQLALEAGCNFVHLGQQDLESADLAALNKAGVRFGISTHNNEELERALSLRPAYVALGPIYETSLKKMSYAPQGLQKITEWKKRIGDLPLVAIGGITLERAPACLKAGADSVAVVTDIVATQDPEARAAAWVETLKRAA